MERELAHWLEQLKKLDAVMAEPAQTLINLGKYHLTPDGGSARPLPSWISRQPDQPAAAERSLLVGSLCCSTLQRLWETSRRYAWLSKDARDQLKALQPAITDIVKNVGWVAIQQPGVSRGAIPKPHDESLDPIISTISDPVFGNLNAFAAAEVFWLLLHAEEKRVISATGVLALFAMLWALRGTETSGRQAGDARMLSAAVVAKCLRPILQLQVMFRDRGRLYREIRALNRQMGDLAKELTPYNRWRFATFADRLSGLMLEMSKLAVNRKTFADAAERISELAKTMRPKREEMPYKKINAELERAVIGLRDENESLMAESIQTLGIIEQIVLPKAKSGDDSLKTRLRRALPGESQKAHNERIGRAADVALRQCREIVATLVEAVTCFREVGDARDTDKLATLDQFIASFNPPREKPPTLAPSADAVSWALARMAHANEKTVELIDDAIASTINWCRFVVRQEVAYASAGNDTEFDVSELLSAVAIAERSGSISELEVEDAIGKALRALRSDGSWTSGQPIYIEKRVLGVWPNSSDIAWLLTGAVTGTPKIRRADLALISFVDWLKRTETHFDRHLTSHPNDDEEQTHFVGWSAESPEAKTIDIWITAGAVNALLEIRDIIEYRLWQLCEKRFYVFRDLKALDEIDPVDLGAIHGKRIHHRLRTTVRRSSGPDYRHAEYSFVLHGPPGSSKTAMAEALGRELWREMNPRRVIRITPADFTRQGEAGLDAEARFIFELISHVRGVTIIFDEIDDLLRRRELKGNPEFLKMVVPAMLNRLQDLRDAAPRQELCFIVAMNYVDNVEPALIRPGRIDAAIPVVYPDPWSRDNTLDRIVAKHRAEAAFSDRIRAYVVDKTAGWPWPLFNSLCEAVVSERPAAAADLVASIDRKLVELHAQIQDAQSHYANNKRWNPPSPELINEVAHFAFAFKRTSDECSMKVEELFGGLERAVSVIGWIKQKLAAEWERETREVYSVDAVMRTTNMGAKRFYDPDSDVTVFRVWAAGAKDVQVIHQEAGRTPGPLHEENLDTFSGEIKNLDVTQGYRYSITYGDNRVEQATDPYTRELDASGGYSLVTEPETAGLPAKLPGWHELVMYQIHPKTFSGTAANGTYEGIIEHLDDLRELGVRAIDLVGPGEDVVNSEIQYDPETSRQLDLSYGHRSGLRKLIEAAHMHDIAVILGVTSQDLLGLPVTDLRKFNGYYQPGLRNDAGLVPDFGEANILKLMKENVRRLILEVGVDGLRWAHTQFVHGRGGTTIRLRTKADHALLREITKYVAELNRNTLMIAHDLQSVDSIVTAAEGCAGFGMQWSFGFEQSVRRAVFGSDKNLEVLSAAVARRYKHTDHYDAFLRIVFAESHESVRLRGRIAGGDAGSRKRAFLATALSLVTPGVPMLLQGQELWTEEPLASNTSIRWEEKRERPSINKRLQHLTALRINKEGKTRGLTGHESAVRYDGPIFMVERWAVDYGINRNSPGNHVVVIANFSGEEVAYPVHFPNHGTWHVRFNADSEEYGDDFGGSCYCGPYFYSDRTNHIPVGPYSMVILSQNPD